MSRTIFQYQYEALQNKYQNFSYPMVKLLIGGKDISRKGTEGFVVSDLTVEIGTGYEASAASFFIYRCHEYDKEKETEQYTVKKLQEHNVALGQQVSISLGYAEDYQETFQGFISQLRYVNKQGDTHHIEVTALDAKGMMMSSCYARQLKANSYGEAVKEIFSMTLYQSMQSMGIIQQLNIEDTPDKKNSSESFERIEQVSESDYEFVVKAAKRFGYEFFIENGIVQFRKGRDSRQAALIRLGPREAGILQYDISYDITGLVKTVEVRGMDHGKGTLVSAAKSASNDISKKGKSLVGKTKRIYLEANVISKETAAQRAEHLLEEISYRFGGLECECVGLPQLKPGAFVEIAGLGEQIDNQFYITNVRHVMTDTEGYRTHLTGQAAGLLS